jgi:hypothetical protein
VSVWRVCVEAWILRLTLNEGRAWAQRNLDGEQQKQQQAFLFSSITTELLDLRPPRRLVMCGEQLH